MAPEAFRASGDDRLNRLLDFLARQGSLRVAEPKAEVHALAVVLKVAATEGVEIEDRFQVRPRHLTNHPRQLRPGEISRDDERKIAHHRGEGERMVVRDQGRLGHQNIQRQLGGGARRSQLKRVEPGGVDFAEIAEMRPAEPQLGASPRGEVSQRHGEDLQLILDMEPLQERLHHPFKPR